MLYKKETPVEKFVPNFFLCSFFQLSRLSRPRHEPVPDEAFSKLFILLHHDTSFSNKTAALIIPTNPFKLYFKKKEKTHPPLPLPTLKS
jgi:hypothetical protein